MDEKLDHVAFALFEHSCIRDNIKPAKEYLSLWQLLPEGARQRWIGNASVAINAVNSYKHPDYEQMARDRIASGVQETPFLKAIKEGRVTPPQNSEHE